MHGPKQTLPPDLTWTPFWYTTPPVELPSIWVVAVSPVPPTIDLSTNTVSFLPKTPKQ